MKKVANMGDRFYESQGRTITGERQKELGLNKNGKPIRKLKVDWLKDINTELGTEVLGLDKCTIDTLSNLLSALQEWKNHPPEIQ